MRRARGSGFFSSQRLPADTTCRQDNRRRLIMPERERFMTILSCRMAAIAHTSLRPWRSSETIRLVPALYVSETLSHRSSDHG